MIQSSEKHKTNKFIIDSDFKPRNEEQKVLSPHNNQELTSKPAPKISIKHIQAQYQHKDGDNQQKLNILNDKLLEQKRLS